MQLPKDEDRSEAEIARRETETLKRLLATPPQPKTKKTDEKNPPKKRGRPKKESEEK